MVLGSPFFYRSVLIVTLGILLRLLLMPGADSCWAIGMPIVLDQAIFLAGSGRLSRIASGGRWSDDSRKEQLAATLRCPSWLSRS